jgi:hypothetical protein
MTNRSGVAPKNRTFFLVLLDDDKKVFNVVGPMTDDTAWNKKVVELQTLGRRVRCISTSADRSVQAIAALYSRQTGFTHSTSLILEPPADEFSAYNGSLPAYAQGADRRRLVKLLCKGTCNATRWAEMNVEYPGREALTQSNVLDFTATCLVCGHEARDSYNWFR